MKKHPSKLKRICAMTLAALMVMQQSSVSSFAEEQTVQNVAEVQPEQAGTEAADNEAVTESENTATAPAETAEQTDTQEPPAQPETTPEAVQPETTPETEQPVATEAPAKEVKQEEAAPTEAPAQETPAAEEPSTEVAAPAAGTEVAPTEAAPTATPEAEKTAFECTVDNVTAAVTLSSPVSDKAAFVIKAYGEGTDYYENAAAVAGQWVESQGLMPLEAAVYDMHFEQEGQELPVAQNASVNLNFACPILTQTPDTDTQTNVYVLHIVNGTAVSAGTANCNGDGAVTSAAINTNGFSPFVFVKAASGDVMAVQEGADENMEDQAGTGTGVNLANVGSGNLSISVIPSSDPLNRENGSIKGVINYSIPNTMKDGSCRAYYTIPTEYLALSDSAEGTIYSSSGVEIGTYTLNTETGLLELLFKKEFYEKSNDIEGYFKFNASVKTDKIKNKNDISLVFPGFGTVDIKVEPGKVTGNKSGKIKYDENGKPYLEYTVNLNATSDLKDFELTDTLGKNLEFIKGSFTFDDEPVDVTIDGNTAKYTRDSIKSGKHTFKYRAAVKDTSDKQALVNEAKWTWTGGKGEAYPSTNYIDDYTISKKGNNFTGRTVKWNVTLTKGTYSTKNQMGKASYSDKLPSDMKFDSDSLVVKDTENGVTLTKDDYTVTESEGEFEINFTYTNAQNVPSYSIEYTTTLKDDVETPEDTKEYKNKGTFTPEGEEPKSAEGTSKWESGDTGYTPGTLTKTVDNVTYDGENAISEWTLTIDPQGKTIDKVQLIDEFLGQNIEGMPYLENATGVKADSITITDKDGKELSYTLGANPYEVKPGYYAYWVINLTEPVSDVIMIHYTAVTFGDMINDSSMLVRNNAGLTWKCDGKDKKDNASDQFTYVKRFGVLQKEGKKVSDNLYEWTVRLNVNSDGRNPAMDYGTDQLVFFSDILPEGMEFVTDEGHTPKYGYADTIYYSANTDAAGIYSVKDGIISATFKGIGKKVIIFTYYTQIKDGYMDGKGDVEFTNKASYGDADGNIADGAVTIKESGNTVTKTSSQKDNLIIYTIDINPNADTLNDGEDLELTDAIPESCAYVPDSLETTENGTEIKVSHKYSNRTITVKIPDKKHIVLTYRVKVNGTQGQNIEVTNTAYLSGKVTIHSTNKYKITIQDTSAGAGGTSGVMNLHKIAEEDETKNLQGATFRLQKMKYNADRQIFEADGDPVEEISDKNGYVSFGKENGDGTILTDTLYYYEEISAPEGYITDKTRHYFYVGGNDVTNFEKQLKAAEIVASQENWGEILISNKKEEEKPETTAALSVSKAVSATPEGSYTGNDEFTFTLAAADNENGKESPMPEGDGDKVTVTAGGEAGSFGSIKYTEAGTYKYTITETVPENKIPGMTYDGNAHEVTVTVSAADDGTLSTSVDYGEGATSLTVTNRYTQPKVSTSFSVKKTVNGADGKSGVEGFDPEETYNFELTPVTEGAPMPTDESGKTVSVTNGETGTFGQITYTEAGKTYEYNITEKAGSTPGMSYDTTPHKVTVTVSETYPLAATVKYDTDQDSLTVNNQYNGLTVKVSKRALKGDEAFALAGAKLQLLDADDQEKPVKEWISGEAPEEIKGLIPGKTYILREIFAPDGYTVAEDTQFVLNRDGTLAEKTTTVYDKESNTLVVNDKLTSVFINKVTEDGKVLAGAILQVLDAEGKAVTLNDKEVQWETTDQPYEITGLKTDTVYTLHEVKAPDGYTLAADINFTIGTDGKVLIGKEAQADNTIVMTDTLTRVEINKVDAVDGKVLAGAKLQVLGKDGKVAEVNGKKLEWTSTEKAHEITGLKTDTVYTLHETVAPTGYDISADTTFTIGTDGKISKSGTTVKVSDDGILLVEDNMLKGASVAVTKKLVYNNMALGAVDQTFHVALYGDEACTKRLTDVKAIVFKNASASTVNFTNLEIGRKYYVAECTADGTAQSSGTLADGTVYMANFTDGNTVTVNEANGTKTVYFNNEFLTVPDGFYKEGKLTVTKKLLGADGNAKNSDEVFYAGIFDDKDHKILSTHTSENVIPLDMADGSETSYTVNVSVAKDAPCVLYVVETDENGTPVEGAEDFEYEVSYSGDSVTVNDSNMNASVTITNKEKPAEKDKDKKDEDTKKTTTTTTNTTTSTNVKTGDNTPIALYVVILLAAAAIVAFIFIFRKKNKKDNK